MGKVITSSGETIYQSFTTKEGLQQFVQIIGGGASGGVFRISLLSGGVEVISGTAVVTYGGTVVDADTIILTMSTTPTSNIVVDMIRIYVGSNTAHAVETDLSASPINVNAGELLTFVDRINLFPYDADMAQVEIG